MITNEYQIQLEGSLPYAKLYTYMWEKSPEIGIDKRPMILICPGSGYEMTSDREADPLAMQFAVSVGTFWNEKWIAEKLGCGNEMLRPAGMILCYPVITSGEYAHRGSFEALLKSQYTEEMLEKNSLEKQVTKDAPKTFLWHTYTDDCVPVENSLLFIQAMKKYDVPSEDDRCSRGFHT